MPKLKMPRKSTSIDMTAMCDVAFLLLTFFMLATKFKPAEPVVVVTPSSISDILLPDNDVMLLTVDAKGRVFFSVDNENVKKELIQAVNSANNLGLSQAEADKFQKGGSVGVSFRNLKQYLDADPDQQKKIDEATPGVPVDTSSVMTQNELAQWINDARSISNNKLRICIKADASAQYPEYKKVIKTLENLKIFKFNLITNLRAVPPGTAAFASKEEANKAAGK